jgi:hypothetical protein
MKNIVLVGFAALLTAGVSVPALAQTTYDTTGSYAGAITPFGQPDTSTYGQTFTVGSDNVLDAFSLYLEGGSGPITFKGYLYAWDGSHATGSALYISGLQSFTGGLTEYDFSTGGLNLASGQQYVAFLSTAGLQGGDNHTTGMPLNGFYGSSAVGGGMVWYNNGNDFGALTTNGWDNTGNGVGDAWFKASFNAGGVPEPASWAMMLGGFGMVGGAMRSRRKAAVSFG